MKINELYNNPTITGEFLLKPFKACSRMVVHKYNKKFTPLCNVIIKVIKIFIGVIGSIITSPLVPIGLIVKFIAKPKEVATVQISQTVTNSVLNPSKPVTPIIPIVEKPSEPIVTEQPNPVDTNTNKPAEENKDIIQSVHKYPGDLTPQQKSNLKANFLDDDHLEITFKFNQNSYNIYVVRENLFTSKAQVIVNAANTYLGGGAGIDGQIHRKGGFDYSNKHFKLRDIYKGNYVCGHAAIIGSGDLKKNYCIENVIVIAGPQGASTPQKENELYSCYINSLILAHKHGKTSIAFPSISTGIFGFPKGRAAEISLKAFSDFFTQYPEAQLNISIHFMPTALLNPREIAENKDNLLNYEKAARA